MVVKCDDRVYLLVRNGVTCGGKKRYPTRKAAKERQTHIFNGLSTFGLRRPERLEPYLCHSCKYWHLGHPISVRDMKRKRGILVPPKRKKYKIDY